MIESIGGPNKVNNIISMLNIPTIDNSKKMERRAGATVKIVAARSTSTAAKSSFQQNMK